MIFTDPHEVPLVGELSVGVAPGTEATIMIQKATVSVIVDLIQLL